MKNKKGISMLSVVITVIVIIILSTIVITSSSNSIYQAGENKIIQELAEVKKGVDSVRLTNAKTGKTDEETINKGFIKVRVENPPENFVSFDEDKSTGYVVDLSVIDYEKLKTGRGYLTLMKDDIVTFDEDDVYLYDNAGKVYYAKGYQIGEDDVSYTADNDKRKEGPIIEVISTSDGVIKVKVTPIYGGTISSVMIGTKRATTSDGLNFELPVNKNGSYKIIATEEGGNSSVKVVEVGDISETASELANLKEVYINNRESFTNNKIATLHIDAENAAYMSVSQSGLVVPSATELGKWRKYESEITVTLKEGKNQIYVWCKNSDDVPTDYKMAEIILDTTPPTREAPTYVINGFQILVSCEQRDEISENLIVKYGFKREHATEYTWQDSPIIVDVDPGEKYVLITKATDEAGNTSESRTTLTEAIMTIPDNVQITANPSEGWTDRVQVTIEYPDTYGVSPYKNLYRVDGGAWKEVTSNRTSMVVIKNCKIEACVSAILNGQDTKMGTIKVLSVNNIDRIDPYIHDVEDIGPYRQDGFEIKAKVYDKESGLVAWTVTTSKDVPTTWDNTFAATTDTVQMKYRVEVNDIYYFWVKDAGNNMGYYAVEVTNIDLYDPIITSFQITYGQGEATLTAKAIDEELGLNAYAFLKGQNKTPTESDWIPIEQSITECTWSTKVTENDYYSIWIKDVSGRTAMNEKYVRVKYTVTYDYTTNKGDTVSLSNNKLTIGCNTYVDLSPTAARAYSSFTGWNTDPNSKAAISSLRVGDPTTNQEDITIYAIFKWEDKITFSKSTENLRWEITLTISKHIPQSTLQYSYDNTNWTNYTSALTITKNRTVYARTLMDGEVIKEAQIAITNICENHSFTTATCTSNSVCRYCSKYNGPALGHNYGAYKTYKEPTCTATGSKYKTCSRCGDQSWATIAALGHNLVQKVVDYAKQTYATCTQAARYLHSCSRCGILSEPTFAHGSSLGHSWGSWYVVEVASCTTGGKRERYCSRCHKVDILTTAPAGHKWQSAGMGGRVCAKCGKTQY